MDKSSIIIITGLSGSGKSTVLAALEDAGYFCIDNLPVLLLEKFLELYSESASEVKKIALCMDLREREFVDRYEAVFDQLGDAGFRLEIIFLEASDEVLIKRYSQTRRHHPVSKGKSLPDSIQAERELLRGLRDRADKVVETSDFTVHQLRDTILRHAVQDVEGQRMQVRILSFGFKYGLPLEADLLIDVRFMPNPYFVAALKKLDGKDEQVKQYIKQWPETTEFFDRYFSLIEYLLPLYEKEGKAYLTLAVGCTGGRHRSVVIAEEMLVHLKGMGREVTLTHRDIGLV
jgi:UPF0042 nucleotide-binding protein